MEPSPSEAPWTLSAPASLVLLSGQEIGDAEALRIVLLELVVRRSLKLSVEPVRRMLFFRRQEYILSKGPNFSNHVGGPMQRVLEMMPRLHTKSYQSGVHGVPVQTLAREVLQQYQPRYRKTPGLSGQVNDAPSYVDVEVVPDLVRLGLIDCPYLANRGAISNQQCGITVKGEAALNQLWQILDDGRAHFSAWADREPARALQFIERAGPAMLLMPVLAPAVRKFALERRFRGDPRQVRSTFGVFSLAEHFGPGPNDGYNDASYVLAYESNFAWESLLRESGHGE